MAEPYFRSRIWCRFWIGKPGFLFRFLVTIHLSRLVLEIFACDRRTDRRTTRTITIAGPYIVAVQLINHGPTMAPCRCVARCECNEWARVQRFQKGPSINPFLLQIEFVCTLWRNQAIPTHSLYSHQRKPFSFASFRHFNIYLLPFRLEVGPLNPVRGWGRGIWRGATGENAFCTNITEVGRNCIEIIIMCCY